MKKFGILCLVLGGLSLVGSMSAGHNPTGPLFWLILGIVLICIANNKKGKTVETTSDHKKDNVEEKSPTPKMAEQAKVSASKPQKPFSFWEQYQKDYPEKAEEIQALGLDFSKDKDLDVKEKVFALETTANDSKCSISSLKELLFTHYDGKVEECDYILLLEWMDNQTYKEAEKYNINRFNTFPQIANGWILDKVLEIEKRYSHKTPRIQKDPKEAIIQFHMEDRNEWSVLRKSHIYLKNYPIHPNNQKYIEKLSKNLESVIEDAIRSFVDSEDCRKNPQLFNALLPMQIYMKTEAIRNDCDDLIKECNDHDVSFYLELEIAEQKVISRYRLP